MKYAIKRFTKQLTKVCDATKFIQHHLEYVEQLSFMEHKAYQLVLRKDGLTKSPVQIAYTFSGVWHTACVDETLTQFFINIVLPIWERQALRL